MITVFVFVLISALWYQPSMAGDVKMMGIAELKARIGNPGTLILDVRADSHWASSDRKIKGALRVDPDNFNSWAGIFPTSRTIVFYCA
jgi:rhodanese-related sulfurtransferase